MVRVLRLLLLPDERLLLEEERDELPLLLELVEREELPEETDERLRTLELLLRERDDERDDPDRVERARFLTLELDEELRVAELRDLDERLRTEVVLPEDRALVALLLDMEEPEVFLVRVLVDGRVTVEDVLSKAERLPREVVLAELPDRVRVLVEPTSVRV